MSNINKHNHRSESEIAENPLSSFLQCRHCGSYNTKLESSRDYLDSEPPFISCNDCSGTTKYYSENNSIKQCNHCGSYNTKLGYVMKHSGGRSPYISCNNCSGTIIL
jgi:Zn finger protein HypA/HybF involved in hydrogenase expression